MLRLLTPIKGRRRLLQVRVGQETYVLGRFGAFPTAEIKSGQTLVLKYRFLITDGEMQRVDFNLGFYDWLQGLEPLPRERRCSRYLCVTLLFIYHYMCKVLRHRNRGASIAASTPPPADDISGPGPSP